MDVPGLSYVEQYLDGATQAALVAAIDAAPWRTDLARRTQHYGYVYDYKARSVTPEAYLGRLPLWLGDLAARLAREGWCAKPPDQAIINEYLPGQGIADHVDCPPCFGEVVMSLSLLAPVLMDFRRAATRVGVWLAPGSLVVMQGEARYGWTHGIVRRRQDVVGGRTVPRARRLSVTFRQVVVE